MDSVVKLLLIEDSIQVANVIFEYFEGPENELDHATNGPHGLELAHQEPFDCIILDVMLPGIDGVKTCQLLRQQGINTPVIMLTARDTQSDEIQGLKAGADDYIVKPFDLELLEARIESQVRRYSGNAFKTKITSGSLVIDLNAHSVYVGSKEVKISPTGFKILKVLAEQSPNVVTRQTLERVIWKDELPDKDILRKHIYQLRNIIDKPFNTDRIVTVPKFGYKLEKEYAKQ